MEYQRQQLFEYQKRKSGQFTAGLEGQEDADMYVEETLLLLPKEQDNYKLNRYFSNKDILSEKISKGQIDGEEEIAQEPEDDYQKYCLEPTEDADSEIDNLVMQFS